MISWCLKKQPIVSCSSTEIEYSTLSVYFVEMTWLCYLLCDLGFLSFSLSILLCDNISAMHLATNPIFHSRSKHIDINFHFVCDRVVDDSIIICYTPIDHQSLMSLQGVYRQHFQWLRSKLVPIRNPVQLERGYNANYEFDSLAKSRGIIDRAWALIN